MEIVLEKHLRFIGLRPDFKKEAKKYLYFGT
jgi:hypothetical protein